MFLPHAIIIGATCYSQSGAALFTAGNEEDDTWDSISPKARFERYMKLYRFKEFRHFYPKIFEQPLEKDSDPWWQFASTVKEFNDIRNDMLQSSWIKVLDESMSA